MEIENFKLIDFLKQEKELIEKYLLILRYINPKKTKREILKMKLKHVELIKKTLNSGNDKDLIKIVSKVQKITTKEVKNLEIIEFFGLVNSIQKQLITISDAELNALTPSEVDLKYEMVEGSQRMAEFGIYNTLESLSNGNALQYKKYMNMEYAEIFTILLMRKTASDIQREMSQLKMGKNA